MMPVLKRCFRASASSICFVVAIMIVGQAARHWPWENRLGLYVFGIAVWALYFWQFFLRPFRSGLKD
jgi:hypothetical protein